MLFAIVVACVAIATVPIYLVLEPLLMKLFESKQKVGPEPSEVIATTPPPASPTPVPKDPSKHQATKEEGKEASRKQQVEQVALKEEPPNEPQVGQEIENEVAKEPKHKAHPKKKKHKEEEKKPVVMKSALVPIEYKTGAAPPPPTVEEILVIKYDTVGPKHVKEPQMLPQKRRHSHQEEKEEENSKSVEAAEDEKAAVGAAGAKKKRRKSSGGSGPAPKKAGHGEKHGQEDKERSDDRKGSIQVPEGKDAHVDKKQKGEQNSDEGADAGHHKKRRHSKAKDKDDDEENKKGKENHDQVKKVSHPRKDSVNSS